MGIWYLLHQEGVQNTGGPRTVFFFKTTLYETFKKTTLVSLDSHSVDFIREDSH